MDRLSGEEAVNKMLSFYADTLAECKRENERLREALALIEFSSHGCPLILDYEVVPKKFQDVIRGNLMGMGNIALEALRYKDSEHG